MKKMLYFAAAALAMVSMSACDGNGKCDKGGKCEKKADQVFTGVVPMADAAGQRYTVKLDFDDDKGNMAGDYDLTQIILTTDTTSALGLKDGYTYLSEGDFTVVEKDGKKYLKLVKDAKDSNPQADDTINFLVSSDSTLTMVNVDLEEPTDPSLYTLKIVK